MTDLPPVVARALRYFDYGHLPEHLQKVSRPIHDLAHDAARRLPIGSQLINGLQRLLEAKDCLVRAALDTDEGSPERPPRS